MRWVGYRVRPKAGATGTTGSWATKGSSIAVNQPARKWITFLEKYTEELIDLPFVEKFDILFFERNRIKNRFHIAITINAGRSASMDSQEVWSIDSIICSNCHKYKTFLNILSFLLNKISKAVYDCKALLRKPF